VRSLPQAELAPIDNYFGLIGEQLEQKILNDNHLLRIIAGAEEGRISLQLMVSSSFIVSDDRSFVHWGFSSDGRTFGNVKMIASRCDDACIIKFDNTVVCWGFNEDGRSTPPSDLKEVRATVIGIEHSCALKLKGLVVYDALL